MAEISHKLVKINDVVIKPIKKGKEDKRPAKSHKIFPICYFNTFILAKTNSGKTTAIWNIMRESAGPDTVIVAWVSTFLGDDNWQAIAEWCEEKDLTFIQYDSIKDGKVDLVLSLFDKIKKEKREAKSTDDKKLVFYFDKDPNEEEKAPKISKYKTPDYIFIFDDMTPELRYHSVAKLAKEHRHGNIACIYSSQFKTDLSPSTIQMMDYILLFGDISEDMLISIYKSATLTLPFDKFMELYKEATSIPYNFLYMATRVKPVEYRSGFSDKFKLSSYR